MIDHLDDVGAVLTDGTPQRLGRPYAELRLALRDHAFAACRTDWSNRSAA